ncbi:CRISPR-associated endonuclease Cas2 [Candidatus Gottesmanbacteria bacterium]|nr:CRISPR-associated endonuclease Cas2 [Candidatus Gottesmanbacteria bacterium]MBI5465435.1 CRISPR-associated endonuclease Cas2 [Candidatus Gottesmanbacteria bacterium]
MRGNSAVRKITYGVCGSIVDFLIWYTALVGASIGKSGSRGVYRAFQEADDFLAQVNHQTLATAWHRLTKKRLVSCQKRQNLYSPQITEFGKKRLEETIPQYHKNRPWDGKIYLITYDIPETANLKRDQLRHFLKQIGAKLLQESTFLTPYNPRQLINQFIQKYKIPGTIIVSDVGKDGGVGETNIQNLLVRLYGLEKLNERYEKFIKHSQEKEKPLQGLLFEYLSILKEDPELPFELLAKGWLGDKAYILYEKLKEIYTNSFAAA